MGDCKTMLAKISKATNKDYTGLAGGDGVAPVNNTYGRDDILKTKIKPADNEDYRSNYDESLKGLETFYIKTLYLS